MLGGGSASAGSDLMLQRFVPCSDIMVQRAASLNVFLCALCFCSDITQDYLLKEFMETNVGILGVYFYIRVKVSCGSWGKSGLKLLKLPLGNKTSRDLWHTAEGGEPLHLGYESEKRRVSVYQEGRERNISQRDFKRAVNPALKDGGVAPREILRRESLHSSQTHKHTLFFPGCPSGKQPHCNVGKFTY